MKNSIYLDNAATSFPKPSCVINNMMNYMTNCGANPSRGSSTAALTGNRAIYDCREKIAKLFNFNKVENVIFTNNITTSLNIIFNALLKTGDHIISSSMEHNSILRPLTKIKKEHDIEVDFLPTNSQGFISLNDIEKSIKSNTKAIVIAHASNLIGSIQDIESIGALCKRNGIFFILDSAQTAGVIPIDMSKCNISALAFTGHKSLFGPQGIGGFIITDDINNHMSPVFVGGTGSSSYSLEHPLNLPDKFECGTLNTPGIIGLSSGIDFILEQNIDVIRKHEENLCRYALDRLSEVTNIIIYGSMDESKRTSTILFNIKNIDSSELGFYLDSEYGITTRTGIHCAPLAHQTVGSHPHGGVRISIGYFNTRDDIDTLIYALKNYQYM